MYEMQHFALQFMVFQAKSVSRSKISSHLIFCPAAAKWLKGTQNRLEIGSHFPDDREFAPTARTALAC
jgi:hypothetical protein